MSNQGFVQSLNLLEVPDGAEFIQNLAGGTVDADMRLFAGLSSKRSQLFWDRYYNTVSVEKSPSTLTQSTQFQWQTDYTYTDDDTLSVTPINLIKEVAAEFIGFDGDGVLTNNLAGSFIIFDRGEGYTPGTYNLNLQGGNGQNATAEIIVNSDGFVNSVEITNSGANYAFGDTFSAALPGNGVGFNVRIIAFPWKVVLVGNFAWDVASLTDKLEVKVVNTSAALDGTYSIDVPNTGVNVWHLPNSSGLVAYDVNRNIYADTKILRFIDLYDADGDGTLTAFDRDLINIWYGSYVAGSNENASISALDAYIASNGTSPGAIRNTGTRIYNYLSGLDPALWDIDDTGVVNVVKNNTYFTNYLSGSNYTFPSASTLVSQEATATSSTTKHSIAIEFLVPRGPGYSVPDLVVEEFERPYFSLSYRSGNSFVNVFDNFGLYGATQLCTTSQNDWINNVQVGFFNETYNYRIIDKYSVRNVDGSFTYFVKIVTPGTGAAILTQLGVNPTLTPINASPVFNSSIEYGVFDSDSINKFFLRTNPRSVSETSKSIVTFSERYEVDDPNSNFDGQVVNVTTLIPDIILERDDSLTTENIENLEAPIIIDDGQTATNYGGVTGGFSYNVDGYADELEVVSDRVSESIYLRSTKYRIDRSLYYTKEISINGFMSSYDPDEFNLTDTDLESDISPGIYISSAISQITNPLASDFANKTRSFSSDYNPWKDTVVVNALSTTSLAVTINDLVWTTEIKLDVGIYSNTVTNQTLDSNFNQTTVSAGESFKLKMLINGEEYFIIMRKP